MDAQTSCIRQAFVRNCFLQTLPPGQLTPKTKLDRPVDTVMIIQYPVATAVSNNSSNFATSVPAGSEVIIHKEKLFKAFFSQLLFPQRFVLTAKRSLCLSSLEI